MRVPKSFPAAMWRILRRSVGTNAEAGFLYNEILRGAQQKRYAEDLNLFTFITLADYFKSKKSIRLSERIMRAWETATEQEPIARLVSSHGDRKPGKAKKETKSKAPHPRRPSRR